MISDPNSNILTKSMSQLWHNASQLWHCVTIVTRLEILVLTMVVDFIVRKIWYNIWILKAKACFFSIQKCQIHCTMDSRGIWKSTKCDRLHWAASCWDNHFIVASTGEWWWEQSHIKPLYLYCNGLTVDQTLSLLILQTIDIWSPHEHNHFPRLGRSW